MVFGKEKDLIKNLKSYFLIAGTCALALMPFWISPLDPGHDLSFQWQAGFDFAKHGTFYHQARSWPTELSGEQDIDGGYQKKWLTEWPPALSCLVAVCTRLGQPVFWVKFFFSLLFLMGWGAWLRLACVLAQEKHFKMPQEILTVFPFLPLFIFVKQMSLLDRVSPIMTDWMVFLIFPLWVLAIRRYAESLERRYIFWVGLSCLAMVYIKYSIVYVFFVSGALILFLSHKTGRFKDCVVFIAVSVIGLLPLFFFLKHATNGPMRSEIVLFGNIIFLASRHWMITIRELTVCGFYDLLRASGFGSVFYMGGYDLHLIHRLGRLFFLVLTITFLIVYLKNIKLKVITKSLDHDSRIQIGVIGGAFLFLSFMTILSGVQTNAVIGRWSYLGDYRYLMPIAPLIFIIFWKNMLLFNARFKHLLYLMVGIVVVYGLFNGSIHLLTVIKEKNILRQSLNLYTETDYEIHRAMIKARDKVRKLYPGIGIVCFRYEIDRGFDRYGIIHGYEFRKTIGERRFITKDKLAVVIAVPTKDNPFREIAPDINLAMFQKIEMSDYQIPIDFYFKVFQPGALKFGRE